MSVPSRIGRYRIVGVLRPGEPPAMLLVRGRMVLAEGEAVTLYRGRDEIWGRDVTIKTLSPAVADDAELRARLEREAWATGILSHPNIVTIYNMVYQDGVPQIMFEALDGMTLQEAIETGIILRVGLPIILQVLDGLACMHEKGIVHRDLKPANVFVCTDGHVKITDLFLAKIVESTQHLTMAGSLAGTPSYMSPEQARGGTLDGRTDLFSLGCVLYEMVTGKKPFRGESITALLFKIITEEPEMGLIPQGPEWQRLRGVITRALQKKPEDRYPDARAMRSDLELALMELGASGEWKPPPPAPAQPGKV